jgi:hypothetical protein
MWVNRPPKYSDLALVMHVRGAGTTSRTAGANQRFIHDLPDGAGATAALSAAAKAAIDLPAGARRSHIHGVTHFLVAQHVAGTDDHREIQHTAAFNAADLIR